MRPLTLRRGTLVSSWSGPASPATAVNGMAIVHAAPRITANRFAISPLRPCRQRHSVHSSRPPAMLHADVQLVLACILGVILDAGPVVLATKPATIRRC